MSLRIYVDKCRDHEELRETFEGGAQDLDLVTRQMGQAMWHTSIGCITEENKDEVLRRLGIAEEVNGAYMYSGPDDKFFTMEDVERRVGMYLNVETKSRRAFEKDAAYSRKQKAAAS
jgi:hypothetical protein